MLTEFQKQIVEITISLYFDDIVDNEDLSFEQKIVATKAMLSDPYNPDLVKQNCFDEVRDSIKFINRLYTHPCPQNPVQAKDNLKPGLLGLTLRSNDPKSPATREDVRKCIFAYAKKRLNEIKFKPKLTKTLSNSNSSLTFEPEPMEVQTRFAV